MLELVTALRDLHHLISSNIERGTNWNPAGDNELGEDGFLHRTKEEISQAVYPVMDAAHVLYEGWEVDKRAVNAANQALADLQIYIAVSEPLNAKFNGFSDFYRVPLPNKQLTENR